jgi:hypothetical protein
MPVKEDNRAVIIEQEPAEEGLERLYQTPGAFQEEGIIPHPPGHAPLLLFTRRKNPGNLGRQEKCRALGHSVKVRTWGLPREDP